MKQKAVEVAVRSLAIYRWSGPTLTLDSVFDIFIEKIKRNRQSVREEKEKEESDTKG